MIGPSLSHYRITAKLGQGGMGEAWRAHDTQLDRDVTLKVLPDEFAHDAERLARFEREAELLAGSCRTRNFCSSCQAKRKPERDDHDDQTLSLSEQVCEGL